MKKTIITSDISGEVIGKSECVHIYLSPPGETRWAVVLDAKESEVEGLVRAAHKVRRRFLARQKRANLQR